MIAGGSFGAALVTQLFTGLWLIGIFGLLLLAIAFCFTGIEFDVEKKLYREYYRMLLFKFGKWQSYEAYKYISIQGVMLSSNTDLPQMPFATGGNKKQTAKLMLLNEQHNKKLLVIYSKDSAKINHIIKELSEKLQLPFAKYNPPVSEATLRRKRSRGR